MFARKCPWFTLGAVWSAGEVSAAPEFHLYEEVFRQKQPAPSMSTISSLMPWARR
jgi:hypothetical protein